MRGLQDLTDAEREALRLVGEGYQTDEIARLLDRSPSTIDNRILAARQKLGGVSRRQAARLVLENEGRHSLPGHPLPVPAATVVAQFDGASPPDASADTSVVSEDRRSFEFGPAPPPRENGRDITYAKLIERTFQVAVCLALTLFTLPWLIALFERLAGWVLRTFYS